MKLKKMCTMHKAWLSAIFVLLTSASFPQGGAAINTTGAVADPSAMLDVSGVSKGVLINRMSTTERNAIVSPAQGLMIINTTTNCIEVFFNPVWQNVYCGCNAPSAPTAGAHMPTANEIIWNWNTVAGVTGYKYNTVNDYSTATDNGISTTFTQTSLICNTPYVLYVWAYGACGNSSPAVLTQSTSACFTCGTSNVTFVYNGSSVTYGTVVSQNSTCWLDRNLGATAVATSYNHIAGLGDVFQWGRLDDGHQVRTSTTTTTLSTTDVPGHSKFISPSASPNDWRSGQNNNLWQGASGINNPCPAGWRLPVETELNNERIVWSSNNYLGASSCLLKLPSVSYRNTDGSMVAAGTGTDGLYWSSTVSGIFARYLYFYSSDAMMNISVRARGGSVRCIKD